jgi:hypothetical protein
MPTSDTPNQRAPHRVLLQALVGNVRLVVQGAGRPTNGEVDEHVEQALGMAGFVRAVLVVTDGPDAAGPDAQQRAKISRAGLLRVPTAVVTESVLARGIMTAVSWLGAPVRGFAPDQMYQAFEFLRISEPVRVRIPAQIAVMKAELRGMRSPSGSSRPPAAAQVRR